MKILRASALVSMIVSLATASVLLPATQLAASASVAVAGGVLPSDTTWTAQGGPYSVASDVQIPTGVHLIIEPGAVVHLSSTARFVVAGTLNIGGTAASPVLIDREPGGWGGATLVWAAGESMNVAIDHAEVTGFGGITDMVGRINATVAVTNSRFRNLGGPADNPGSSSLSGTVTFDGNELIEMGPISVGPGFAGPIPVAITNNRFVRTNTNVVWPQFYLPRGVTFAGNTFGADTSPAVNTSDIFADEPEHVDLTGNYWGTTDQASISARIRDYNDDISNYVVADFVPFLTSAPTGPTFVPLAVATPTAVRGPKSATVTWRAPASDGGAAITSYTVASTGGGAAVTVPGTQRSAVVSGLADGVGSTFTVTAHNAVGASQASATSNSVVPASPPAPPQGVTATRRDGSAVVNWKAAVPSGAPVTGYVLTTSPGKVSVKVPASSTRATLFGLRNGTSYTVSVVALSEAGDSAPGQPSTAVTPVGRPTRVAKPTLTVKGSKVIVSWRTPNASGSPLLKYVVSAPKAGSKTVKAKTTAVGATKRVTFKKLKRGTYKFRVVAYNAVGSSTPSAAAKGTLR